MSESPKDENAAAQQMPNLAEMLTPENIQAVISNMGQVMESVDVPDLISQFTKGNADGILSSELMNTIQNLAGGGQGKQIIQELQKQGINPKQLRSEILAQQRLMRKTEELQQVLIICRNRKVKLVKYPIKTMKQNIILLLKTSDPMQASCSRMAVKGTPLEGKKIYMWHNTNHNNKNRRASKLLGCPVAGDAVVVVEGYDISLEDLSSVEKYYQD